MPLVSSGVEKGNLRELALARMQALGLACRDVRTREAGIVAIHHQVSLQSACRCRRASAAKHEQHVKIPGLACRDVRTGEAGIVDIHHQVSLQLAGNKTLKRDCCLCCMLLPGGQPPAGMPGVYTFVHTTPRWPGQGSLPAPPTFLPAKFSARQHQHAHAGFASREDKNMNIVYAGFVSGWLWACTLQPHSAHCTVQTSLPVCQLTPASLGCRCSQTMWSLSGGTMWRTAAGRPFWPTRILSRTSW